VPPTTTASSPAPRHRRILPFATRPAIATLLLMVSSCTADTSTSKPAPPNDMHFDSVNVTIKGKPFSLEIADTDEKRERGLMYRSSMPADHGMIFLFDTADKYSFWMKNTLIPLDIIFLDADGKVIDIEPRKPLDETGMGPKQPAKFVIELNGGTSNTIGLSKGDQIDLPNLLKQPSRSDEK
jgi:uncharacterized membrane protein (UPF0127 family)